MDLFQLETFLAVAAERSFSRAALRLHRTQPAVSQTIRKLESDAGDLLLDRSRRDVVLTDAGRTLAAYAEKLLALRGEARQALGELRSLRRGKLAIAANELGALHLVGLVSEYRRLHPLVKIEVGRMLASRIPAAVLDHQWELGLVTYRPQEPELACARVYRDRLALVAAPGHPLARRKRVGIRDLGAEIFVAHNVPSPLRHEVIAAFQRHHTPLHMEIEMPTLEAIRRCVAAGLGIALTPRISVEAELARGALVEIGLRELKLEHHLRVIWRREGHLSHAAESFFHLLRERARAAGKSRGPEEFLMEEEGRLTPARAGR